MDVLIQQIVEKIPAAAARVEDHPPFQLAPPRQRRKPRRLRRRIGPEQRFKLRPVPLNGIEIRAEVGGRRHGEIS
jgi:hypothetical protein